MIIRQERREKEKKGEREKGREGFKNRQLGWPPCFLGPVHLAAKKQLCLLHCLLHLPWGHKSSGPVVRLSTVCQPFVTYKASQWFPGGTDHQEISVFYLERDLFPPGWSDPCHFQSFLCPSLAGDGLQVYERERGREEESEMLEVSFPMGSLEVHLSASFGFHIPSYILTELCSCLCQHKSLRA